MKISIVSQKNQIKRKKKLKCDWNYTFPRLYLIDFKKGDDNSDDDISNYEPEKAIKQQLKKSDENKEINNLNEKLDEIYDEEFESAKYKPLSKIVQAYNNVYGCLPNGHPQKEFE